MTPSELAAIKEDLNRRNPDGYVTTESKLLAEVERLRGALQRIAELDYSKAAVNCAAYDATQIAREALEK